jgi:hypothetical protein
LPNSSEIRDELRVALDQESILGIVSAAAIRRPSSPNVGGGWPLFQIDIESFGKTKCTGLGIAIAKRAKSAGAVMGCRDGFGDTYLSFAVLYGLHVGSGGGSSLDKTDLAGCLIRTA